MMRSKEMPILHWTEHIDLLGEGRYEERNHQCNTTFR